MIATEAWQKGEQRADGSTIPAPGMLGLQSSAPVYRRAIAQERFAELAVSTVLQVINGDFDMGSTADKVGGKANEVAGKVRQGVGDALNDKDMQAKGLAQEAKGDAQQAKGKAKDAVKNVVDRD